MSEEPQSLKTLFDLNEDCLGILFNYLDFNLLISLAEVSSYLEEVLHRTAFKKVTSWTFKISELRETENWKAIVQSVGPHLRRCSLTVDDENSFEYIAEIVKTLGKQMHSLSLSSYMHGERLIDVFDKIKAILRHISTLELRQCGKDTVKFDLRYFCPNLQRLYVEGDMDFGTNHWPKLQSVYFSYGISTKLMQSFLNNNLHLREVRMNGYLIDYSVLLHMPNLEVLQIGSDLKDFIGDIRIFENLKKLCLKHTYLPTDWITAIATRLTKLTEFSVLNRDRIRISKQILSDIGQNWTQLEYLDLGWFDCDEQDFLSYIQRASNLIRCRLPYHQITLPFVRRLTSARRTAKDKTTLILYTSGCSMRINGAIVDEVN